MQTPTATHALSEKSAIRVYENAVIATPEEFDTMFAHPTKPTERRTLHGRTVPRDQNVYSKDPRVAYRFSGLRFDACTDIPPLVERCMEFCAQAYPDVGFNGALVNWYNDGADSIGEHADDENDMERGTPIMSFSFNETPRDFIVRPKPETLGFDATKFRRKTKRARPAFVVSTLDASCIAMCGNMQREFTHEIKKQKRASRRINITVRKFVPIH